MIERTELLNYLDELLAVSQFQDYCPNGLQIEGKNRIKTLISGVSAGQALLEQAVALEADAILVHHGYFWRGEPAILCNMKKRRIATLLQQDINLFAYHLPLDTHPVYGNNAQLAKQLNLTVRAHFPLMGVEHLGWIGDLPEPMTLQQLSGYICQTLHRPPLSIEGGDHAITTLAWCSGAAQDGIHDAAAQGADAYLSGEIAERTFYEAKELHLHYLAAGHHATERGGVKALGDHLAQTFNLTHHFIDSENPV